MTGALRRTALDPTASRASGRPNPWLKRSGNGTDSLVATERSEGRRKWALEGSFSEEDGQQHL
jgi:hypothetical protein